MVTKGEYALLLPLPSNETCIYAKYMRAINPGKEDPRDLGVVWAMDVTALQIFTSNKARKPSNADQCPARAEQQRMKTPGKCRMTNLAYA